MKFGKMQHPRLTPREVEVANLICHEYTCKAIANQLGLSTTTIITHMVRIKKKLGVSNVAGVVRVFVQNGWLEEQRLSGVQSARFHSSINVSVE